MLTDIPEPASLPLFFYAGKLFTFVVMIAGIDLLTGFADAL